MKKLVFIVFLVVMLTSQAYAWTWGDTARQTAFLAAHTGNYFLVTDNIRKASKYDEYNMTDHQSVGEIGTYFITSAIAHTAIAVALDQFDDKSWLRGWQYIGIGAEIGVAVYGVSLGVNLKY